MSRSSHHARKIKTVAFETVRQLALALPGVEEGWAYGTPAFRVKGKFMGWLRENGESFVISLDFAERELLRKRPIEIQSL